MENALELTNNMQLFLITVWSRQPDESLMHSTLC